MRVDWNEGTAELFRKKWPVQYSKTHKRAKKVMILVAWIPVILHHGCLLREKDSLGLAFFFPKIKYCSSRIRFSCSRCIRCRSSSIFLDCSTMAKRSSACIIKWIRGLRMANFCLALHSTKTYEFTLGFFDFLVIFFDDPFELFAFAPFLFLFQTGIRVHRGNERQDRREVR